MTGGSSAESCTCCGRVPADEIVHRTMALHHDLQPLQSLEPTGYLDRYFLRLDRLDRPDRDDVDRLHTYQSPPLGSGCKRGDCQQTVGRSRGGRITKIHAFAAVRGCPVVFLIAPGNRHDLPVAHDLLPTVPSPPTVAGRQPTELACGAWRQGRDPIQPNTQASSPLRQKGIQGPQLDRTHVLSSQGLQAHRNPLRQARRHLYVRDPLGSRAYLVDQLSPDPRRSRLIKDFKSSKEEETINIFVYGFLRDRMTVVFVGRTFSNLSSQLMDGVKVEDTGESK